MRSEFDTAYALAKMLHRGQVDKAGRDYFEHVERVAEAARVAGGTYGQVTVAYLHDVVEDTAATLDDLRALGFSEYVIMGVDALTRRDGETYAAFIARVAKADASIRAVKIADIRDHLRERADGFVLSASMVDRYTKALAVLGAL